MGVWVDIYLLIEGSVYMSLEFHGNHQFLFQNVGCRNWGAETTKPYPALSSESNERPHVFWGLHNVHPTVPGPDLWWIYGNVWETDSDNLDWSCFLRYILCLVYPRDISIYFSVYKDSEWLWWLYPDLPFLICLEPGVVVVTWDVGLPGSQRFQI